VSQPKGPVPSRSTGRNAARKAATRKAATRNAATRNATRNAAARNAAATGTTPSSPLRDIAARAGDLAEEWAPIVGRVALGLVLAWFGYHELVRPGEWTGYVPVISPSSSLAIILVLAHGWVLLVLAVALVAGIAPRAAAAVSGIAMLEIVISLTVSGGLSDLILRDLGVFGLAVCLTGCRRQRLVLRG
jgi:uncharacterized membrane protein YphA (DoxX/SURF4 family)